jgi:hypothetical protein
MANITLFAVLSGLIALLFYRAINKNRERRVRSSFCTRA